MCIDNINTYLLLGSNLGNREQYLENALKLIQETVGPIFAKSAIYETEAWGKTDQPGFLNLAIGVTTSLTPTVLLETVLAIEKTLGRVRHEKWGSRLIDIDIILYGDQIVKVGDELQIPHVEMQHRKFVLQPLAEIAPEVVHPILQQSMVELLKNLNDPLIVAKKAIS
ncbi:2-amino-4-hydroxy-6-hydroxymethyldihydropteridine diphosphokinase [Pedobacter sp. Hv1]|uniref:2-amino-4-hydroxy-6- hydroxymethyldihydropteridine diphosphokinase n=1 Tax=Pedobacter sp. Hv1 TaxID=1740090 RepID=UPI0006D8C180|nr:2-amino-4-hydroxy-6-hydroxymethyldihydropteridine diphosphokinase [Pedobacter sp. Hv1]KQC01830.1 2-amino-4-hydroxy-6-hydroxymethyldihydropteridine pyrophosphokinase [Pedobacter sp. Hv1]